MQQFSLKTSILEKVSKIVPIITLLLVPIFFLPTTSEFFSFNKLALITIATIVLIILWGLKTIAGEKLEIIKSPIDISLMALLVVVVISTIFSVNKTDSIFGSQGRWLGLMAFITIVGYFYLSTPAFKESKTIKLSLYFILITSTISSLASILSYYKIFIGSQQFLRFQNFSLTGSIKDAIILAVISVIVSLMLSLHEKFKPIKLGLLVPTAINFYFVAVTGTALGWILLVTGLILMLIFVDRNTLTSGKMGLLTHVLATIAPILALIFIPATRNILVDKGYIGEFTLPARESWAITTSTIRDYPILATGPATFHLNYSRFKPLSINNTIFWNNRFDKPYNEVFNSLSTLGIVGTAIALVFAVKVIFFAAKSRKINDESGLINISGVLVLVLMISFLFNHATVLSTFLLFLFLGLLIGAHMASGNQRKYVKPISLEVTGLSSITPDEQTVITGQYTKYILSIPAFILAGYLGYANFRNYTGEYYMRKSLVAIANGDIIQAYDNQIVALKYNSKRDTYYDAFAKVNMTIATALASKDPNELTETDKQNIQALISQALRNSKVSTEEASPLNVANWETRALIYRNLVNVAQNAYEWSINSYDTAIQLDPVSPRLRLDLGGVYFAKGEYLAAANQFRQAVALKQDYANARYNFALSLIMLGEYEQAKRELDITKLLVPQGSDDEKLVEAEIQNLMTQIQSTSETTGKPTVEELTGVSEEQQPEPLTNIGEPQEDELNPEVLPQQRPERPSAEVTPAEEVQE